LVAVTSLVFGRLSFGGNLSFSFQCGSSTNEPFVVLVFAPTILALVLITVVDDVVTVSSSLLVILTV